MFSVSFGIWSPFQSAEVNDYYNVENEGCKSIDICYVLALKRSIWFSDMYKCPMEVIGGVEYACSTNKLLSKYYTHKIQNIFFSLSLVSNKRFILLLEIV